MKKYYNMHKMRFNERRLLVWLKQEEYLLGAAMVGAAVAGGISYLKKKEGQSTDELEGFKRRDSRRCF